jgi:hypothetical protein
LIPAWATRATDATQAAGGRAEALRKTLANPELSKTVRSDIAHEIARRGGADNVIIFDYTDKSLYG